MFVDETAKIKVTLYYKQLPKTGRIQVVSRIGDLGERRLGYSSVTFELRSLSWKQKNELMRQSRKMNSMQQSELDWETYREKLLVSLITKWDAKEGEQPIALTPENVLRMNPQVAEALLYEYEHSED